MSLRARTRVAGGFIAYVVLVAFVWEAAVRILGVPAYIIETPTRIARAFVEQGGLLLSHSWITLYETVGGFLLGAFFGLAGAVVIALSSTLRTVLMPTIVGFQSIPKVAIAPLFAVWFGIGLTSKIILVISVTFFPVLMSTLTGLTTVDADMIDLVRGMRGTSRQLLFKIRLPYAVPHVFSGMKIAVPLAMVGAIVAEFIAAQRGLGNLILTTSQSLNMALNFAALIAITIWSSLLFQAVVVAERLVLRRMHTSPAG